MSAHTPGPWSLRPSYDLTSHKRMVSAATVERLALVSYEADARLIAAAPDLLAIAQQYASECGNCNGKGAVGGWASAAGIEDWYETPCPECQDIRNVIERATRA